MLASGPVPAAENRDPAIRPNVVLIITDDQGYGDVRAHGNGMIGTPHLDKLWAESVRLTDFHVDPTCSPTRSALMSGRYSTRTGVWHTIMGRSLMDPKEVTIAETFAAGGYRTGMFGKWHLGDNYPLRPEDQGFHDVVHHGGGGVGQGPDWWGNDYFDDTYWRNGVPEKFTGYCTDVWFDEAVRFIEESPERPFFCYLSTNAPHGPLNVAEKYSRPYVDQGVPENMAKFYGMITNIDENIGRLRAKLDAMGLAENTILIFMTDNGTANGAAGPVAQGKTAAARSDRWLGFNAGMRGTKGSEYDGGHRVPCFIHWPAGGLSDGRDVDQLSAHVDVQPTLADLCGLNRPNGPAMDGTSLKAAIYGEADVLRDRTLFVHSQRIAHPEKWRKSAVMTDKWRLVNGVELYDIEADPGQQNDLAAAKPDVVEQLRRAYDGWWESLEPTFSEYVRIGLGADADNPTRLMCHDWLVEEQRDSPWNQGAIQRGMVASGPWAVNVEQDGRYRFELYRWPKHLDRPAGCTHAKLSIGKVELEKDLDPGDPFAAFEVDLKEGPAMLRTWMTNQEGEEFGAYFVWVQRVK